jgi:hypothetical protein
MSNATELLRRALAELIDQDETICAEFCGMQPWRSPPIIKAIYDYLDAEPEAEPVAYTNEAQLNYLKNPRYRNNPMSMWASVNENVDIPLYTISKPTRKPLTDDDMWRVYIKAIEDDHRISGCGLFILGVRFAEKHHKIGDEQ